MNLAARERKELKNKEFTTTEELALSVLLRPYFILCSLRSFAAKNLISTAESRIMESIYDRVSIFNHSISAADLLKIFFLWKDLGNNSLTNQAIHDRFFF